MKKRWNCPECGTGKLLSSAPRKNATGRYCLKCSEATGFLVERTCPALEKKRAAGKAKSAAKAKAKAEKAKAKFVVNEIDLQAELARVYKVARRLEPNLRKRVPDLTFTRSQRSSGTSGRAWGWRHRVHLSCGTSKADMLYVLVHEVAHILMYARDAGAPAHGDWFKSAEAELQAACGIENPRVKARA